MQNFKKKKILKIYRLLKFIKNNKLKKKRIFKLLGLRYIEGLRYRGKKNYKIA
jgi:hypothetical protein